MRLGAGEVLEQVAERRGRDDPQVDRDAVLRDAARAVVAAAGGGADHLERGERRDDRGRIVGRDDDVEVLDAVAQAPRGPRDLGADDRGLGAQPLDDPLGDLERAGQRDARAGRALVVRLERGEDRRLGLRARSPSARGRGPRSPRRAAHPASRRRAPRTAAARSSGPTPSSRVIATTPGGNFARSFSAAGIEPGLQQRRQLLLERLADARQLGHAALAHHPRDRLGRVADRLRGVAVGDDAVDHRAVQLVQVAELVERRRKVAVRRVRHSRALPYAALMRGPAWLVLPTFNEAENLERIVTAARGVLTAAAPGGFRILVVDDGSPDGTGAIADRLARRAPRRGRGAAPHDPRGARPRLPRGLPPRARRAAPAP